MKIISFDGRCAVPQVTAIGNQHDHNAERVQFVLPHFEGGTATLHLRLGEYADVVDLPEDGVFTVTRTHTQRPGRIAAHVTIQAAGELVWHSDEFALYVGAVQDDGPLIEQAYPTAVESALAAAAETRADREAVEQARAAVEDALGVVEGAAEAETARQTAEAARAQGELVRKSAEQDRTTQEAARAAAELARAAEEQARAAAECDRENAESVRAAAETTRATAETARQSAESARAQAETAREQAEASRAAEFSTWQSELDGKAVQDDAAIGPAAWSSLRIVDALCPPFEAKGGAVRCAPVAGYPLNAAVEVIPEEGAEPPESVRVTRCGTNLLRGTHTLEKNEEVIDLLGTVSSAERLGDCYTLHTARAWQGYKINFSKAALRVGLKVGDAATYSVWTRMNGKAAKNVTYSFWVKPVIEGVNGVRLCLLTPEEAQTWRQLRYTFTVTPEMLEVTNLSIECGYYDTPAYDQEQAQTVYAAPQLEVGGRATAHEPYRGDVYTLPLTGGAGAMTLPALAGTNTLIASAGTLTVTGRADPARTIAALTDRVAALEGAVTGL